MKVAVGDTVTILKGILADETGIVVEIYTIENEVVIDLDSHTTVITSIGNIEQSL